MQIWEPVCGELLDTEDYERITLAYIAPPILPEHQFSSFEQPCPRDVLLTAIFTSWQDIFYGN